MRTARYGLLAAASALCAQGPASSDVAAGHAAMRTGRYLAARDAFARAAFGPDGKVRDEGAFQSWAQYGAMITGELPPDTFLRRSDPSPPAAGWAEQVRRASARDALAEIVRRARSTSIVILNEGHDSPRDRAFALTVARARCGRSAIQCWPPRPSPTPAAWRPTASRGGTAARI